MMRTIGPSPGARWSRLPLVGLLSSEWQVWRQEQTRPLFRLASLFLDNAGLSPYPLDMEPLLALPHGLLDQEGVPYNLPSRDTPGTYHPTTIGEYALAHWNAYLARQAEHHKEAFLVQVRWLVAHEQRLTSEAGGWPIPFPSRTYHAQAPWLSAMTQGIGVSVLVRAYQLAQEQEFLHVARRALRPFEADIRAGGVCASIGQEGIFFEEVAVYPAAHILNGALFAFFGLYDYLALTQDANIAALIQHGLMTLHSLLDAFDLGYWSRYDLLHGHPAPHFYHDLHILLLQALASYSGCAHCAAMSERWARYQQRLTCHLRYLLASRGQRYRRALAHRARCLFSPLSGR